MASRQNIYHPRVMCFARMKLPPPVSNYLDLIVPSQIPADVKLLEGRAQRETDIWNRNEITGRNDTERHSLLGLWIARWVKAILLQRKTFWRGRHGLGTKKDWRNKKMKAAESNEQKSFLELESSDTSKIAKHRGWSIQFTVIGRVEVKKNIEVMKSLDWVSEFGFAPV